MLRHLKVERFQSLSSVEIELGPLTVIQGPSSSGKSALVRAARALARNVNSPAAVSQGSGAFAVTATVEDGTRVVLERGKGTSVYRLIGPEGQEQVYTKSGTAVPEDVVKVLAMRESEAGDLFFAEQFDRPYLVAEPATQVSRAIGSLTNVLLLHEAVRETNRRRLEASGKLKVRKTDLEGLTQAVQAYKGLPVRKRQVERAREILGDARVVGTRAQRLAELKASMAVVNSALAEESMRIIEVPDVEPALRAAERLRGLRSARQERVRVLMEEAQARGEAQAAEAQAQHAQQEYDALLEKSGTCPVCGKAL